MCDDLGVATLSPSSTTSGDTAPYSPSADSSSSSSDCSSSPDAPSPPRLVPIFKKNNPRPFLATSTSIMTAVSAVSAVLAAADHKQRRPPSTRNTSYSKQQQSKPSPRHPLPPQLVQLPRQLSHLVVVSVRTFSPSPSPSTLPSRKKRPQNNSSSTIKQQRFNTQQKRSSSPQPQPAVAPTQEDLNKSAVPKKARLDSGTTNTTPKPLISPTKSVHHDDSHRTSTTFLQLKKAKRKLAEAEKEDEPDSRLKVATTSVSSSILIPGGVVPKGRIVDMCLWRGCCAEVGYNLLEHIQTVHVGSQSKGEVGFVCLWEGCKVFNRKSSSRSWLERHVLYHSGNKPFKCIFPGCGQSFGFKGPLRGTSIVTWPPTVEAHSHSRPPIATKSTPTARSRESGGGRSSAAGSRDSILVSNLTQYSLSLCKNFARNVTRGQHVDYFDKRVMELIKHRLASSISFTRRRRITALLGDRSLLSGEWPGRGTTARSVVSSLNSFIPKRLSTHLLPKDKLPLVFPSLFPTQHIATDKARRKWCPSSSSSLDNGDDDEENEDSDEKVTKTTASLLLLPDEEVNSSVKTSLLLPPPRSSSFVFIVIISIPLFGRGWGRRWRRLALDALLDNLFLTTVSSSSPPSS
ncbi:Zinc finger protein jing [Folsomia candida]|uniref:Zinc finger protein jing n=1 Tax=Folsomia candida TaxID=158441 RepID=A0A226CUR5_FOLCA|nr:Zinc finger protein jing [Folsomia candida]